MSLKGIRKRRKKLAVGKEFLDFSRVTDKTHEKILQKKSYQLLRRGLVGVSLAGPMVWNAALDP